MRVRVTSDFLGCLCADGERLGLRLTKLVVLSIGFDISAEMIQSLCRCLGAVPDYCRSQSALARGFESAGKRRQLMRIEMRRESHAETLCLQCPVERALEQHQGEGRCLADL